MLRIGGSETWGEFFKGYIDEVRIYNRALSAGEIATDMNTPIATSSPTKPLLGSNVLGSASYSIPQGTAAAFQTTASGTGVVTNVTLYVDQASSATRLIAGIYADNNGHPGKLLKGWDDIGWAKAGNWNMIALPAFEVAAGTKYWIAVLSPNGLLNIRYNAGGSTQPFETSQSVTLASLPSLWITGTLSTNGSLSGYGAGY